MTIEIDLTKDFDPKQIVDDMTYASYKFNRLNRPDISPEKWATIFRDGATLEKWYQKELQLREQTH